MVSKCLYKNLFFIFMLAAVLIPLKAQQDVTVIQSDANSILIEYKSAIADTSNIKSAFGQFIKVKIPGGLSKNNVPGQPDLMSRIFSLGVPEYTGNVVQVISSSYKSIQGQLAPLPRMIMNEEMLLPSYEPSSESYSSSVFGEIIELGNSGLSRDLVLQSIILNPVQFNYQTNEIRIYDRIVFRVDYAKSLNPKTKTDDDFNSGIINWDVAKNWATKDKKLVKARNSVLATGTWYRFPVTQEGIYEISGSDLPNLGIDPNTVDPSTIKIYSNGGNLLAEDFTKTRPEDLTEIAITVETTNSKVSKITFYGRGVNFWEYKNSTGKIVRNKNFYAEKNYYWITSGGTPGKRCITKTSVTNPSAYKQTKTPAFYYYDNDLKQVINTGRIYVGDDFISGVSSRVYTNSVKGIIPGSKVEYRFGFVNESRTIKKLQVYENNTKLYDNYLAGGFDHYREAAYNTGSAVYTGLFDQDRSLLKFVFDVSGSTKGHLDFYEILFEKQLQAVDNYLKFYAKDTTADIEYTIDGFSASTESIKLFDISDYANVKLISGEYKSGAMVKFGTSEIKNNASTYLALSTTKYGKITTGEKVDNSNIQGYLNGVAHIIISPKAFSNPAKTLKTFRNQKGTSSDIFYIEDIFNEFGGGLQDPTAIRDFIKYAFDTWQVKPLYVVLLGDGTSDFLKQSAKNFIPVMPTEESFNTIDSHPEEDYYINVAGTYSIYDANYLDLSIGRLCVGSEKEAEQVINKIIAYESNTESSLWQNKIVLVADDAYAEGSFIEKYHVEQSETLANYYIPKNYDLQKIYLSAYPLIMTGAGRRKPAVTDAIIEAVNNEALVINYFGHGSPSLWAHEHVLEKTTTIPQFKNKNLFLLTVASCDFAWFDDHESQSSSELLSNMDGGAVGVIAASRPVYANENADLDNNLFNNLLNKSKSQGYIGKALTLAKNNLSGFSRPNSRKYLLIGDPATKIKLPQYEIKIDSINGKKTTEKIQINALSKVKMNGSVKLSDGTLNSLYNGEAVLTVFDSKRTQLLDDIKVNIDVQGGIIFRGKISVTNGLFSEEFIVPKDISYENKEGKIVVYAYNTSGSDAIGYTDKINVGGTGDISDDKKGPFVDIYFDDAQNPGISMVQPNFNLIVKLEDETGLNTTGTGIGHKLEAVLDDQNDSAIDLTNFFIGNNNTGGKSGEVRYKFSGVEPGEHSLKIKAWDVFNNLSEVTGFFTVVEETDNSLKNVYNYPNPFSSNTSFTFMHGISGSVDVKIKIYTISGKPIKTLETFNVTEKFVTVDWDGYDEDRNLPANGTYFYKLIVKSADGSISRSAISKLSIVR